MPVCFFIINGIKMAIKTLEGVYNAISGPKNGPYILKLQTRKRCVITIQFDQCSSEQLKEIIGEVDIEGLKEQFRYKLNKISIAFQHGLF